MFAELDRNYFVFSLADINIVNQIAHRKGDIVRKLFLVSSGILASALLLRQITKPKIPTYEDPYVEVPPNRLYYRLHNHVWYFLLVRMRESDNLLPERKLKRFSTGHIVDAWHYMRMMLSQQSTDAIQAKLVRAMPHHW